jgi:hypothetical protein
VTSGAVVHAGQRYRLALLATHAQGGRKEMVFGGSALQGGVKNLPIDVGGLEHRFYFSIY